MKFLTGLLNSNLVTFWLRHKGKMQGDNFQVDKEPLLNIPLPDTTVNQQPIISIVDKILEAKQENSQTETSDLEHQIDIHVYKIYNLTYDEVKTIDPEVENKISREVYDADNGRI